MTVTGNINRISDIYRQWQPFNPSGAPEPGEEKPSAVMPVDRVSLSEGAFREDSKKKVGVRGPNGDQDLDAEAQQQVKDLKKRDAEVKSHEQAHMASGGGIVQGGATYEYQTGPDGRMYAVGGEVKIDLSPERTPEATILKMQQARRAALAPAQPSGTDRAVAAQASQIEAQARMERTQKGPQGETGTDQNTDMASSSLQSTTLPASYASTPAVKGLQIDLIG